jgi:hypothetical protein
MRRGAICAAILIAVALPGEGYAQSSSGDRSRTAQPVAAAKSVAKKPAAPAKVQPAWRFIRPAGLPTLEFGVPGSETVISFSCQAGSGLLRVISYVGSRGPRPGDGAAIRLSSGKNRFEVAGTAFSLESGNEIAIAGTTKIDGRLFTLLRGESTVLDVQGRRRTLPLANGRPGIDAFERACGDSR